jgi:hypothetical protein
MDCLVGMVIALFYKENSNLMKVAAAFPCKGKVLSNYRRIQRFLSDEQVLDFNKLALFIVSLFGFLDKKYELVMDRTNWKWGQKNINILMLALVYKGVSIPVYWTVFDKRGNSNTQERITLVEEFIAQFGKQNIIRILADREFVGEKWLNWLKNQGIDFGIRLKKDSLVTNSRGDFVQIHTLFRLIKKGESMILPTRRKIYQGKTTVYISGLRLADGSLLILATDNLNETPFKNYSRRWQIETLFHCLKSRGFHLENTHVTDSERIKRLLAVLAIAFCWAHRVGEMQNELTPIKLKKHQRPAKSLFRAGLDWLSERLSKWGYALENEEHLLLSFKQMACPS